MDLLYLALGLGFFALTAIAGFCLRTHPEALMDPLYVIALIVTVGLFAYLVAVLFFPERFS